MLRFTSAVALAAALAACPTGQPPRPPLPPPPAGHIKIGSGVTDGRSWTAYRYMEGGQRCVSVADETDRSGGSTCGSSLHPFSFATTALWIWSTSKTARSVRLEFADAKPVTAQVLATGEAWPVDHAFLFFPLNDDPSAVVVLDANGKELRRVDCSAQGGCGPD